MSGKIWTEAEDRVVSYLYSDSRSICIANLLKRPISSIWNRAQTLNLRKTKNFKTRLGAVNSSHPKAKEQRFKKGLKVWNKGMKGLSIGGKKTQFKKGSSPHNTKPDGYIREQKDGYFYIRVGLKKWTSLHRHIWEQANGEVPKGMILVFKDKNPKNYTLDNLEVISRAENMKRNTIHNYPPEINKTLQLVRVLTRKINQRNGKKEHKRPTGDAI